MSERYPLLPEMVLCMVGLYLGLIGVFHRSGVPTQSEMIAARIEERTRQRTQTMQDAPRQPRPTATASTTQPTDLPPRLPAAVEGIGRMPSALLPEALRTASDIPTLRLTLVEDVLHVDDAGTLQPAGAMLERLQEEGISEARIRLPVRLMQDERVATWIADAMRQGIAFHVEMESTE